jgi:hypothetical protein
MISPALFRQVEYEVQTGRHPFTHLGFGAGIGQNLGNAVAGPAIRRAADMAMATIAP